MTRRRFQPRNEILARAQSPCAGLRSIKEPEPRGNPEAPFPAKIYPPGVDFNFAQPCALSQNRYILAAFRYLSGFRKPSDTFRNSNGIRKAFRQPKEFLLASVSLRVPVGIPSGI